MFSSVFAVFVFGVRAGRMLLGWCYLRARVALASVFLYKRCVQK